MALEIALLAVAILLLYYYGTSNYNFWKSRGVNGPKPEPFFGNTRRTLYGKDSLAHIFNKLYAEYKNEPMVGLYRGRVPILVMRDPELIKTILVKDFAKFSNRTKPIEVKTDLFSEDLFNLDVSKWQPLRNHLTPVFTSAKLKLLFQLMLNCAAQLENHLDSLVAKDEVVECRAIAQKFTIDTIGICGFGIEIKSLSSESTEFRKIGNKLFATNWRSILLDRMKEIPILFYIFGPITVHTDIKDFFINVTKDVIDYRTKHNIQRHDFFGVLMDLKKHPEKIGLDELRNTFAASQTFVLYAGGYETSSQTITHSLYELAQNHPMQDRVRKDIMDVLRKTDGKITFDCMQEMTYLQAFISEILRKYPIAAYLSRMSNETYTFPGTKTTIPKGQTVVIPGYAIHRNPDVYPNPEVIDPERFLGANGKGRHDMHYLPFSHGPRNCIGKRFAFYQVNIGLITILTKYKVDVCEKTEIPYVFDWDHLFMLQPAHDIHLKMTKLKE